MKHSNSISRVKRKWLCLFITDSFVGFRLNLLTKTFSHKNEDNNSFLCPCVLANYIHRVIYDSQIKITEFSNLNIKMYVILQLFIENKKLEGMF